MGAEDVGTHGQRCPPTLLELYQEGPADRGSPPTTPEQHLNPQAPLTSTPTPQDVSSHLPAGLSLTLKL